MTITKELIETLKAASNYVDTLGGNSIRYRQVIAKAESAVSDPAVANPAKVPDALLGYLEQIETTLDYVTREGQNTFTVNEALQQLRKAIDLRVIEVAKAGFKYALTPPAEAKREVQQISEVLRIKCGLTLVKTASGYDVMKLGDVVAHNIGAKEQ